MFYLLPGKKHEQHSGCIEKGKKHAIRVNCPLRAATNSEQPTFKCNVCFNSTHRTSRSQSTLSQEPCEWFVHDLLVLLVKLEQILLRLRVDSLDLGLVQDRGSSTYTSIDLDPDQS